MKLECIIIKNFRSIKNLEISFDHNCKILIGKNEAGKSNILKAIAAVFGAYSISDKDKRKKIKNEKIEDYSISALLKLNEDDLRIIKNDFNQKFIGSEIIKFNDSKSFDNYLKDNFSELLITLNFKDELKSFISFNEIKGYELQNKLFIDGNLITLNPVYEFDVEAEIKYIINSFYANRPIKCNFWEYKSEYLLPNYVNIDELKTNPNSFPPVSNLFALCGRDDIKKEFENAIKEDGDYLNLLDQVSDEVTKTFRSIWGDLINVSIQLTYSGNIILIKVIDNVKFNCEDRSEGFKKFISILLMLSTKARADLFNENDLILIDEPDQSLYPTSARFLRDELLEISKKVKVLYTTHSQYMIDTNCIERHIIVEKESDFTSIKTDFSKSPFTEDEILKRAIGTSIFESLKPINFIFEGYLDMRFFKKYISLNNLEKEFKNYGTVYLAGISGIDNLVSILMLAEKKFIIVSDSDTTSNNKFKNFIASYPEYSKCWLKYADVKEDFKTIEDFLSEQYVMKKLIDFDADFVFDGEISVMQNIDKSTNGNKDIIRKIKNELIENVKLEDLKVEYQEVIQKIRSVLELLKN